MTARRLGLVALLAAAPAPAFAQDMCAALDRIGAAARESPSFESVRRALADGEAVVPGFEVRDCRVRGRALVCDDFSFNTSNFDAWPDPLHCPGLIAVTRQERPHSSRDRRHAYTLAGLHIEYGFSCWGCAGGPHSFFSVSLAARGRPED